MEDLTGLGKLADSKLVNKTYDDLLAEAANEAGKSLTDFVKVFRLFTFPIQLLAATQDRLARFCDEVRSRVPEERQIEAAPSIAVPILLSLRHMEDDNPLTLLYLELLSRAIDRERVGEAHPAFARIIEQMSPDEAMVMFVLRGGEGFRFDGREPTFPLARLGQPELFPMYIEHLAALNLVSPPSTAIHSLLLQSPSSNYDREVLRPTRFGELFIRACVPENEF